MTDIFISYSSKHRDRTETLAAALEREGYRVWWDKALEAYASFGQQIDAALSEARVVVVIWSQAAAESDYVIAEARESMTTGGQSGKGRLVNLLAPGFEGNAIPKPMGELQAHPVEDIAGVVLAIGKRWAGERPRKLNAAGHYERATGHAVLSTKRDTISAVAHVTPALLLNARFALAPFLDVHGRRAALGEWAQSKEGKKVRGKLIHGPGGLGKTRLMVEVCADLREKGWEAGFVEAPASDVANLHRQAIESLIDSRDGAGLLLVLDYAERRQDEAERYAARMKKAAQNNPDRPLRLALLARSAGEWWDRILEEMPVMAAVFSGDVEQLLPLPELMDRQRLFTEAIEGFREAIQRIQEEDPDEFADWDLDPRRQPVPERLAELAADAFARPLMIQIAALLHLQGETPDTSSIAALLGGMLGVERRYWKAALGEDFTEPRHLAIKRGAMQTTLSGEVSRAEAEALLLQDTFFKREVPADAAEPLADLERVLGDGAGKLMAVEPDLIGEHLIAEGDMRLMDACLAWAGEDTERRRAILTVLQRASREEHGRKSARAREFLEEIIIKKGAEMAEELIAVALETPGELVAALETVTPRLNLQTANALSTSMPSKTQQLAFASLGLAEAVVTLISKPEKDDKQRAAYAAVLAVVSIRNNAVGRRQAALAASEEAVGTFRELAQSDSGPFQVALVETLHNLSADRIDAGLPIERSISLSEEAETVCRKLADSASSDNSSLLANILNTRSNLLSDIGRHEEAIAAAEESVRIFRELKKHHAGIDKEGLARSLNTLSMRLSETNRHKKALAAAEEAATIWRGLSEENPDAFLPGFAASISRLSSCFSEQQQHETALSASKESLTLYRGLVEQNPEAFLDKLAGNLHNLSLYHGVLGDHNASLTAAKEAVKIWREISEANPDAFLGELATSLMALSHCLQILDLHESARDATEEAVGICRQLVERDSERYLPKLARSLQHFGADLAALGQSDVALNAYEEAVIMCRGMVENDPERYQPNLVSALRNLGNRLSALNRHEAAREATEEAVGICRQLVERDPECFLPELAHSLHNLGADFAALGESEAALRPYKEAVKIRRELAKDDPGRHQPELVSSLRNLGNRLTALDRHEGAREATEEAVGICRQLVERDSERYFPELAHSLHNLGADFAALGESEAALRPYEEAVKIRRELAEIDPVRHQPELVSSLRNLGNRLSALARHEAARDAAGEAVEICRELVERDPDRYLSELARSLQNLGFDLADLGQSEAALEPYEEAVRIRRALADSKPDVNLPGLSSALNSLACVLCKSGQYEAALVAAEESVKIRKELASANNREFLPELAASLHSLGDVLSALERRSEAIVTYKEAATTLNPCLNSASEKVKSVYGEILADLKNALRSSDRTEAEIDEIITDLVGNLDQS
jgi:tetratricopeptide (TPR) repeat protein